MSYEPPVEIRKGIEIDSEWGGTPDERCVMMALEDYGPDHVRYLYLTEAEARVIRDHLTKLLEDES